MAWRRSPLRGLRQREEHRACRIRLKSAPPSCRSASFCAGATGIHQNSRVMIDEILRLVRDDPACPQGQRLTGFMWVEAIHPLYLSDGDAAAWRAVLAADPALTSPYLTPDWAKFVGRRRDDARVAIWREDEDGSVAGFLAVQRPSSYAALPIGGPVNDYQAVVGPKGLDLQLAVKALDVGRIDFTAGLKDSPVAPVLVTHDAGHVARFPKGWDAWVEERQAAGSKIASRARKKLSKLTRDHDKGDVVFEP